MFLICPFVFPTSVLSEKKNVSTLTGVRDAFSFSSNNTAMLLAKLDLDKEN